MARNKLIDRDKVIEVWNAAESPEAAAKKLGMTPGTLRSTVTMLRKLGCDLKSYAGKTISPERRAASGRALSRYQMRYYRAGRILIEWVAAGNPLPAKLRERFERMSAELEAAQRQDSPAA